MRQAPRHTPERTCVGCRAKRQKRELVRIAQTPDGVRIDPDHRLPGRGAYVCPEPDCVTTLSARDGQALRRALRGAPQDQVRSILDQLLTDVGDVGTHGSTSRQERGNA